MNKVIKKVLVVIAILIGVLIILVGLLAVPGRQAVKFGVTFSQPHATGIGLNWQETYLAILDDLGVRELRLVAYWNAIEPSDGQFNFTGLDYQMDEAEKRGARVMLAIGRKVPRWPECHEPAWAGGLTVEEEQQQALEMLEVVVERYKNHNALVRWQLENEPFLDFGICPPADGDFLKQEESLIRSLDKKNPILVTDSGELNWWLKVSAYGDMVGTTMYRTVWSQRTENYFHYDYIFPAWLYRAKARIVKVVREKDVLVAELQGEPWGDKPFVQMSAAERAESLSPERLGEIAEFARRAGLSPAYWWGVEHWYWEKEVQGEGRYWELAKGFFK